ncbi:MAG: hypothetical protein JWN14_2220 [Chthonomonadales bacterium]|nr:hypothetical protein [Chthonomonadales bacterium]
MKRSSLRLSTAFSMALAACAVALAPIARAQGAGSKITYATVDYPGAFSSTSINGINDFDEFVGIYDDAQGNYHAFEGKKGSTHFKAIDFPGAVQTYVFRINNLGEVVGTYFDTDGYQHGFIRLPELLPGWSPFYLPFDVPGAGKNKIFDYELGTGLGTSAFGLNDWGQVVGQYADSAGVGHGYVASLFGFTTYTAPDASQIPGFIGGTGLAAINNGGDVAGLYSASPLDPILVHGFMIHNGRRTLIDPPGSILTEVFNINDGQEVSGFYYDAMHLGHGYIYNKAAKTKFQMIDVPGAVYVSTVGTVNNVNSFVGEYVDGFGITHGYIATRKK